MPDLEDHEKRIANIERVLGLDVPTTPPTNRLTAAAIAGPNPGEVTLSWHVAGGSIPLDNLVTGRNGTDTNGSGPWSTIEANTANSRVFDKLAGTTAYKFTVIAMFANGVQEKVEVTATPTAPPPTPEPEQPGPSTGRSVPLVSGRTGGSGLPFNLIGFRGGAANLAAMKSIGDVVGKSLDGGLTFPPRHDWLQLGSEEYIKGAKAILDAGGIVVISIPHLPEMYGDDMNAAGAQDKFAHLQRGLAAKYAAGGLNNERCIFRIDWEFNGNWYKWSANRGGGRENLKKAIANCVTNFRAGGLTKNNYWMCSNGERPLSGAALRDVFPGKQYISGAGIDQYDQYPAIFSAANWEKKQKTVDSIRTTAEFAREQGIMWSLDEAGNVHGRGGDGGMDNPLYWEFLAAEVKKYQSNCAWWNIYNHDGAPATYRHTLDKYNPKSQAKLRSILANW